MIENLKKYKEKIDPIDTIFKVKDDFLNLIDEEIKKCHKRIDKLIIGE